jgi:hypothetical protein
MNNREGKNGEAPGRPQHEPPEKGDARRQGGPGEPKKRTNTGSSRELNAGQPAAAENAERPQPGSAMPTPKQNREQHAKKHQPEESGPGRASKPPPAIGRFEPRDEKTHPDVRPAGTPPRSTSG